MRKVLTSFAVGEQAPLLNLSGPRFLSYARRHGYDLFIPDASYFRGWTREPSWWKLSLMLDLFDLRGLYDLVLWLDADVMIVDEEKDIAQEIGPDDWLGLTVHRTKPHGEIPNCGVMVARSDFVYRIAPALLNDHRAHPCWEQGALMAHMGTNPAQYPVTLPAEKSFPWKELAFEWNAIDFDGRWGQEPVRFIHCTGSKFAGDKLRRMEALEANSSPHRSVPI